MRSHPFQQLLSIGNDQVHLWYLTSEQVAAGKLDDRYRGLISNDERDRLDRFVFEKDRRQYLLAHVLLRLALSRYADVAPELWQFAVNDYGKPEIVSGEGTPSIRFNLSHTAGLVACAVTHIHDVGVDVENIEQAVSLDVARKFFSISEVQCLEQAPVSERKRLFFDFWTLKESYIKARGMGLSIPLSDFSFHLSDGCPPTILFSPEMDDDPNCWQFFQVHGVSGSHRLSVAVCRPVGAKVNLVIQQADQLVGESIEE